MATSADVKEEDVFQILVATDCHLGYCEKDAVRGSDSLVTFEEILNIAVEKKVDFILLGGDLFHENKPSRKVLHECMHLLRKYCMGDLPIQFEFISDQSENFKHNKFPVVNYEDPNINISIPVFSIHGNHDDPAGLGSLCSLDLLGVAGLVNYFGKCVDLEHVQVSPILLQKGKTKLAMYGLGSIRDERLHRLFRENKVSMLRPRVNADDWFNLFVLHQNRAKHGLTNYIPEQFLDDFIDLVIWGHEHECRVKPEWNGQQSFYVTQPGSSVATSLCHGEAVPKHVGLLEVSKKSFKLTEIPLRTVRQFYIEDIDLDSISINMGDPEVSERVIDYCKEKVDGLLEKAERELSGHPKQPRKPLIRLRVFHTVGFETFSVQRFGHSYVDKVANPKDVVHFSRKKSEKVSKDSILDADMLKQVLKKEGFDKSRVEDLVKEYFQKADDTKRLSLLSENGVSIAVQEYVDKDVKEAINALVDHQVKKAQKFLKDQDVEDSLIDEEVQKFREDCLKNVSADTVDAQTAVNQGRSRQTQKASHANDDDELSDDLDDTETVPLAVSARPTRGRGRGRGARGSAGGRSSAASRNTLPTKRKTPASRTNNTSEKKSQANSRSGRSNSRQSSITSFCAFENEDDVEIVSDDSDEIPSKRPSARSGSRRGIRYSDFDED